MRLGRKSWIWFACAAISVAAFFLIQNLRFSSELDEQIRLARKEGLWTTFEDVQAGMPEVDPSKDATPFLAKISKGDNGALVTASDEVTFHPNSTTITAATGMLRGSGPDVALAERAGNLPHASQRFTKVGKYQLQNFDASSWRASLLLLLRGSVYAAENKPDEAVRDAERSINLAKQDLANGLDDWQANRIVHRTILRLEYWWFMHPKETKYRDAIEKALPDLDYKSNDNEARYKLYQTLAMLDLDSTRSQEYYKWFGLKPDDLVYTFWERFNAATRSPTQSKAKIVRALRTRWSKRGQEWLPTDKELIRADQEEQEGAKSFLTYARMLNMSERPAFYQISDMRVKTDRLKLGFLVLKRALAGGRVARTLNISDLTSPLDPSILGRHYAPMSEPPYSGKLVYDYDQVANVLTVKSRSGSQTLLRIPAR